MTDEYEYHQNKRSDKVYISKAFEGSVLVDRVYGPQTLRIMSKVFDSDEGIEFAKVKKEIVIRRTPGGRQELKVCFFEDSRQIHSITFQKFTVNSGAPHKCSFTFTGDEIGRLFDVLEFVKYVELESGDKQRVDESVVNSWRLISEQERLAFLRGRVPLELIKEIVDNDITLLDVLTIAQRKQQLQIFEQLLKDENYFQETQKEWGVRGPEAVWQTFFEKNPWIFGYGLRYVFTTGLDNGKLEQVTTGYTFNQSGKRVDALLKTQGYVNALCFVEIKTHKAPLLASTPYRAESWSISTELAGSIAQIQKTVKKAEQELRSRIDILGEQGDPTGEIVFAYTPKSFVVIGSLDQFSTATGINEQRYGSFEIFRRSLGNPEIITFDELYERARFIVAQSEESADNILQNETAEDDYTIIDDEDIPF